MCPLSQIRLTICHRIEGANRSTPRVFIGYLSRRPQPQQVDTRIGTVKLQVTNRSGVTLDAIRLGIIDPD